MLKNPYPNMTERHFVVSRVGVEDYFYLKKLFPMTTGLTDKILSILFKKFIDELRILDTAQPLESAWYVESTTNTKLGELLDRFQRCSFGLAAGSESPRHESGAVDQLHQEVLSPEVVSPVKKSGAKTRRRSNKKEGKVDDRTGDGVTHPTGPPEVT